MGDQDWQQYEAELAQWRASVDEQLCHDDGWLTLTGLAWLHIGPNSVGSDPSCEVLLPEFAPTQLGVITLEDNQAVLDVQCDEQVFVNGELTRHTVLQPDRAEDGPSIVTVGSASFFVIQREAQLGVRIRDKNNSARRMFTGTPWFPADPTYRVEGQLRRHAEVRTITVETTVGIPTPMPVMGDVEFTLHGHSLTLLAFTGGPDSLFIIFKDSTNGQQTYSAARYLSAPITTDDRVTLDFNRASNPPCAVTPYATCPLAPRQNHLVVPIEAGAKTPAIQFP